MQVVGFENDRILQKGEVRMGYKATVRESGRPIVQSFLEWPSAAHKHRVNSRTPSYPHNGLSREIKWSDAAQFRPHAQLGSAQQHVDSQNDSLNLRSFPVKPRFFRRSKGFPAIYVAVQSTVTVASTDENYDFFREHLTPSKMPPSAQERGP